MKSVGTNSCASDPEIRVAEGIQQGGRWFLGNFQPDWLALGDRLGLCWSRNPLHYRTVFVGPSFNRGRVNNERSSLCASVSLPQSLCPSLFSLVFLPVVSLLLHRLQLSLGQWPTFQDWAIALLLLLGFCVIYLPLGFRSGFLQRQPLGSGWATLLTGLQALLYPGIGEEVLFRALPLPHPSETVAPMLRWIWVGGVLLVFIVMHPLNILERSGTFRRPVFLLGASLLGLICTLSYLQSGSLWGAIALHTLIVTIWLTQLGGLGRLQFGWPTQPVNHG